MDIDDITPDVQLPADRAQTYTGPTMSGVELIAAERQRQIDEEGWNAQHDDEHDCDEMAMAAACYAAPHRLYERLGHDALTFQDPWPWEECWDKRPTDEDGYLIDNCDSLPRDRLRQLVKAGALIAAEIDRLQRIQSATHDGSDIES
jgi:hypothetical protein